MVQIKFVKEIPIINGTYKKDTPNSEIGYQKWRVRKTYEVEMEYEITAKTKELKRAIPPYFGIGV